MQPHDTNIVHKWVREKSDRHHHKQLYLIKHRSRMSQISPPESLNFTQNLYESALLNEKARAKKILQGNRDLLARLSEVSKRKRLHSNYTPYPKSLNFTCRKREAERIFQENKALMRRLTNKEPILKNKEMREEYNLYEKYKKEISRASLWKKKKLPPISDKVNSLSPKAMKKVEKRNFSLRNPEEYESNEPEVVAALELARKAMRKIKM